MPIGTALLLLRAPSLCVPLATRLKGWFVPLTSTHNKSNNSTTSNENDFVNDIRDTSAQAVAASEASIQSSIGATGATYSSNVGTSTVSVAVATEPRILSIATERDEVQPSTPSTAVSRQHVIAFASATVATIVGTIAAWVVVGKGAVATGAVDHAGMTALAAALCASYIGGSVNFAAILQACSLYGQPVCMKTVWMTSKRRHCVLVLYGFCPPSAIQACEIGQASESGGILV